MKKGNKKVQNVVVESVVTVEVKKGRKVDPTSKRQVELAARLAKKELAVQVEDMINEAVEEVVAAAPKKKGKK